MSGQLLDYVIPAGENIDDYHTQAQYLFDHGWKLHEDGNCGRGWYYTDVNGGKHWNLYAKDAYVRQRHWEIMFPPKDDPVNHPKHYNRCGVEVIDVIEAYAPANYHLGNVIKYVCRSGHKGSELEDWKKARWYLDRLINHAEEIKNL